MLTNLDSAVTYFDDPHQIYVCTTQVYGRQARNPFVPQGRITHIVRFHIFQFYGPVRRTMMYFSLMNSRRGGKYFFAASFALIPSLLHNRLETA